MWDKRLVIALMVASVCVLPAVLNLFGLSFASSSVPLTAELVAKHGLRADDLFFTLRGALHHALLEWSAVSIALIAFGISLLHYKRFGDVTIPLIGLAMLAAAGMDSFHTLAAMRLVDATAPNTHFIPFTWALSRTFNATVMILSLALSIWIGRKTKLYAKGPADRMPLNSNHVLHGQTTLLVAGLFLIVAFYFVVSFAGSSANLPHTMFPHSMIVRPFDVLPLTLFFLVGAMAWNWYSTNPSSLKLAIVISVIPGLSTQFYMVFGSTALFDNHFNIAHFLKIFSYGCILFGLVAELSSGSSREEIDTSISPKPMDEKKHLEDKIEVGSAKRSLLVSVPIAIFLLSVSIALMTSFSFYAESEGLFYENAEQTLRDEGKLIKPILSRFYKDMAADALFLSRTPPILGITEAINTSDIKNQRIWAIRLEQIFAELIAVNPEYQSLSFIAISEVEREIVKVDNTDYGLFAVPSSLRESRSISSLGGLAGNLSVGEIKFSSIYLMRKNGTLISPNRPTISAITPIFDSKGVKFGAVIVTRDFNKFVTSLREALPTSLNLRIANSTGDYIVHQDESQIFGFERGKSFLMQKDFPELKSVFNSSETSRIIYNTATGIDTQGPLGFYQLLHFDEFGISLPLRLFLEYNYTSIHVKLSELRNKSLLLGLSLALIALALGIVFSRRIMDPLMQITHAVEAYDRLGEMGALPLSSQDELGVLARSFHNASLQIDAAIEAQQILTKVAERSSLQLGAIVDEVVQAIINISADGKIVNFNRAAEEIFGYRSDEALGENVKILMPESDAISHDGHLSHYQQTGETNIIGTGRSLRGERKNGQTFPMMLNISEVNIDGNPIFIGFVRDMSKEDEAEKQRQFDMTVLEASMNMMDNGLLVTNNQDVGIRCNRSFLEMFGVKAEFIENQPLESLRQLIFEQFVSPEMYLDVVRDVQGTKNDWSGNFNLLDGRVIDCKSHFDAVDADSQGREIRVWSFRDVTQQTNYENQMLVAKEKAEQAVAAKSDFLASMSHEIRTPMNGVLGMLGLLRNEALTQSQDRKAKVAQASAHSLLYLINDILDFSKIEADKLDLEMLDFNLRSLLGDFAESMALRAQEKNIELILDLRDIELSMVRGDPGRIRQIMTNLVGNALKFTQKGEVTIRAALEIDGDTCRFNCEIIDTGIGIPPDKIATLFESFTQVDASTTRKFGGTGLGLTIVQRLVNLMDGTVEILSEIDQGSCFTINVGLELSNQSEEVVPTVSVKDARILVVDDHAVNREVLSVQLQHWGALVTESHGGQDALNCLEKYATNKDHQYQIAFVDMNMPDMDGASLGKFIRANPAFDCLKLVLMTSVSNRGDAKHYADLGFSAYFPKPTTTADIFDALAVLLGEGDLERRASPLITSHYLRGLVHKESKEDENLGSAETLKTERLLLVEDNEINQLVATEILADFGIVTEVAINGEEALKALKNAPKHERFTIVLMDCQMPIMDGYDATEAIRRGDAGSENADIPIIAMTANAMIGDKEKCLEAGMNDYLSKPVDVDQFESVLRQWSGGNLFAEKDSDSFIQTPNVAVIWDKNSVLNRMMGKESRLKRIVQVMVEEFPNNMTELQEAIVDENLDTARQIAHMIEGVVGNLSGDQLQDTMGRCGTACAENDLVRVNKLFSECFEQYEALLEELNLYLES